MKALFERIFGRKKVLKGPRVEPLGRELTQGEREQLGKWLNMPETKLALGVMESRRPSVWPVETEASVRLYQIQGWEMYRDELLGIEEQGDVGGVGSLEESYQRPEF